MYKIAILGCENSHAKNFLDLIAAGAYPEIEVVGVYSNEPEAAAKLHDRFGVAILDRYDALAGKGILDGIMITARHGDNHYKYARPYLDDGIPMFIDKPITATEADALLFMREARDRGIRLCGGSTCAALPETLSLRDAAKNEAYGRVRGGSLACPIQLSSPYGGFTFYAQHLIEIMTTVFGADVRAISATKRDDSLLFTAHYADFDVTGTYLEKSGYYHVSLYGEKGADSKTLNFTPDAFRHEMDDMYALLCGKPMQKSYESFITPVFLMNTVLRAVESGRPEPVPEIRI